MTPMEIAAFIVLGAVALFLLVVFFQKPVLTSHQWAVSRLFASLGGAAGASVLLYGKLDLTINSGAIAGTCTGGIGLFVLIWFTWARIVPSDELGALQKEAEDLLLRLTVVELPSIFNESAKNLLPAVQVLVMEARGGDREIHSVFRVVSLKHDIEPLFQYLKLRSVSRPYEKLMIQAAVVLAFQLERLDDAEFIISRIADTNPGDSFLALAAASIEEHRGKPEKARSILMAAKPAAENDVFYNATRLMFLGHLAKNAKRSDEALGYLRDAYELWVAYSDVASTAQCAFQIAEVCERDGDTKGAQDWRCRATQLSELAAASGSTPSASLRHKAVLLAADGQYDLAQQACMQALAVDRMSPGEEVVNYNCLAELLVRQKKYGEARKVLSTSAESAERQGCIPARIGVMLRIAELEEQEKNFETAQGKIGEAIHLAKLTDMAPADHAVLASEFDRLGKRRLLKRLNDNGISKFGTV